MTPDLLFVGGYTSELGGKAPGISTYRSELTPTGPRLVTLEPTLLVSPSCLVRHPTEPWLFAVSESAPAQVHSLRIEESGSLTPLTSTMSGGDGACHLALDVSGAFLVVAHYSVGAVSSIPVNADGSLGPMAHLLQLDGSGPDPDRQERSHAHQVVADGPVLLVPDLGADVVWQLRLDEEGRLSHAADPVAAPAGSGPRHLAVLGDVLVCAFELTGQIGIAHRSQGVFTALTVGGPASEVAEGPVYPSALRAEGRRVYVANRGPGTVAVFELDSGGVLRRLGEFAAGGPWPRDLVVATDGRVWVANQSTDEITVHAPAAGRGRYEPELAIASPSPASIVLSARPGSSVA